MLLAICLKPYIHTLLCHVSHCQLASWKYFIYVPDLLYFIVWGYNKIRLRLPCVDNFNISVNMMKAGSTRSGSSPYI